MQSPYFSPNWVEAAKPIWEGSLEEGSSATLLGIGMSSLLPGVDCNCQWMEKAPQKWSAVVVCWGYVDASSFLCYSTISLCRQDEIGWLFLFTSFRLVFTEFCGTERTVIALCNRVVHSSKWNITYQPSTVFYFLPVSYFLLSSKCAILSMTHRLKMKMRLIAWPYMLLLRAKIYGAHFLSRQSWRSKRCKCQSVSP